LRIRNSGLHKQNEPIKVMSDSDYDESSENESATEEETSENKLQKLRKELEGVPLGEIQKLKEKVGLKRYNEVIFGGRAKQLVTDDDESENDDMKDENGEEIDDEDEDEDDDDEEPVEKKSKKPKTFEKGKKSEPEEISSKKPKRWKPRNVVAIPKRKFRDPRFDDLSGTLNQALFEKSYQFVDEMKKQEKEKVGKALNKERNANRKEELKRLYTKMNEDEKKKIDAAAKRKREKELRSVKSVGSDGQKKTFYLKKSDQKKIELAQKYEALKTSGKLDSYLAKKRKRNAAKERKRLPTQQRTEQT